MPAISSHVIGLMSLLDFDSNHATIVVPLSRPDYMALNKVLEGCGGKWDKKVKAHVFPEDAAEILDAAMLTGEWTDKKRNFDQFDSPPDVVDMVIARAKIGAGMLVLEPQAGLGFLATEAAQRGAFVETHEIDPMRVEVLKQNPAVQLVREGDFLLEQPRRIYDRVIMNPPFSKQQDIDHVLHALKFVAPGGILVSVMSAGVLFRTNIKTRKFRDQIIELGGVFENIPEGAFKSSGTMVRSVIVKVQL